MTLLMQKHVSVAMPGPSSRMPPFQGSLLYAEPSSAKQGHDSPEPGQEGEDWEQARVECGTGALQLPGSCR